MLFRHHLYWIFIFTFLYILYLIHLYLQCKLLGEVTVFSSMFMHHLVQPEDNNNNNKKENIVFSASCYSAQHSLHPVLL